jgi:hypothetical protein
MLNMNKKSISKIMVEDLDMGKVCAKTVPRVLMHDTKNEMCHNNHSQIWDGGWETDFLNNVTIAEGSWIFHYDSATKRQSVCKQGSHLPDGRRQECHASN